MLHRSFDDLDALDAVFAFASLVQQRLDTGRDVQLPGGLSLDAVLRSLDGVSLDDDEERDDRTFAMLEQLRRPTPEAVRRIVDSLYDCATRTPKPSGRRRGATPRELAGKRRRQGKAMEARRHCLSGE